MNKHPYLKWHHKVRMFLWITPLLPMVGVMALGEWLEKQQWPWACWLANRTDAIEDRAYARYLAEK